MTVNHRSAAPGRSADKRPSPGGISFFLNGERVILSSPDPSMMLIDYLRSPNVGLFGAKEPCGQGGCGCCTVILSHWDKTKGEAVHRSINACLRPVCALNGLSVTTIEGTGRVQETMNPVAYHLAANNGTQCGYCANGWVMVMTGFLANRPTSRTKKDIEALFDGNLCRCTGYRSILTGMKTFASDWTPHDEANRMKCEIDPAFDAENMGKEICIDFPDGAKWPATPVRAEVGDKSWIAVRDIDALRAAIRIEPDTKLVRLVHGNTSFGIYREEVEAARLYIDIRAIPDLYDLQLDSLGLTVGAGIPYCELIQFLQDQPNSEPGGTLSTLSYMARRTAGSIVRNAASLGGNIMLVLKHIRNGEPFPSDMATVLCGLGAEVDAIRLEGGEAKPFLLSDLMTACARNPALADDLLLLRFRVPIAPPSEVCFAQKVALREVNAHSIVNATTRLMLARRANDGQPPRFGRCQIVFGGIAPYPWSADDTAAFLEGKDVSFDTWRDAAAVLVREVEAEQKKWCSRMADEPDEGFTNLYRRQLTEGYLYKAIVNALLQVAPETVPTSIASAGVDTWGTWPVSDGTQCFDSDLYDTPLRKPYIKLAAMYQAQGEVKYTHEKPVSYGTLFGALVQSSKALARYRFKHPETGDTLTATELVAWLKEGNPDFTELVTAGDIPAGRNLQGMGRDQPVFAIEEVEHEGQCIALVLAETQDRAEALSRFIQDNCIDYAPPTSGASPVLTIHDALADDRIFPDCPQSAPFLAHIWKVTRPQSDLSWARDTAAPPDEKIVQRNARIDGAPCKVIESTQICGSQLHFYMETQSCIAEPRDGNAIQLYPSTQDPKSIHGTVSSVLEYSLNQIGIQVPQIGGSFGGKSEQSRFVAAMAAVGSKKTSRPVHLMLDRASDSALIGRRHPYLGRYQLAVDSGSENTEDKGLIRGLSAHLWGDGGAFYDCSFVVSNCIQLRVDNAYFVPNYQTVIDVCRTNKAPNTSFRAFGDIQGVLILENAIEEAAIAVGMDACEIREKNLYAIDQTTPGGQALEHCYLREVWDFAKEKSDFANRKKQVADFNAGNKWRKRGIALLPLKYGSGFPLESLEQSSALVNVYAGDGSVLIRQGGVDVGQGMLTKIVQVAAHELNVPIDIIRVDASDTRVIPDPTSTGASTGTQYNGQAVRKACIALRERLKRFCLGLRDQHGEDWCRQQHIDYWNHGNRGWNTPVVVNGQPTTIWRHVVSLAFAHRVDLQAEAKARIPGGEKILPHVEFKSKREQPKGSGIPTDPNGPFSGSVNEYVGFTYNAACAEVEVDILTGETKICRVDIVYDMGVSINPAIDIGQIEGAFVQGIGYLLAENLVFQQDGPAKGRLNTVNTWRYKLPATTTIPLEMNVHLFPRELAKRVPENPNTLYSSKEVGEPPLVLANSVFLALKNAVRSSRVERGLDPQFRMDAPATVQEVRRACAVDEIGSADFA
jgi:xanthine dehydrogenase/oxidase